MAKLTEADLAKRLRDQLQQCAGWEEDAIAADRRRALDYYFQRPNGTEVPGRAQVVSGDLSAMVESNLASITEALSDDELIEIKADSAEDVEQAQLEADALVHFVMHQSAGRYHLSQAIKDTLLLRNGWIKVWCEKTYDTRTIDYENVSPEAFFELTNRPHVETYVHEYDPDAGTLRLRETIERKVFRAEYVPAENMRYPRHYHGCDFAAIQRIPFIAESRVDLRSDLLAMFPKARAKIENIPQYSVRVETASNARDPKSVPNYTHGVDKASELILWHECYALLDMTGNGRVERYRVAMSDDGQILHREPVSLVPYATGQCFLAPGRLTGISLWDKLRQNQDTNTALKRALLDNVSATSKQRTAYLDGRVNTEDMSDGRVNGAIRVKANVARVSDAVMPFSVPDTSEGIRAALEYMQRERRELGGSALDMASSEMQIGHGVGSEGLDRAYSVAEQLAAHMCRNIADTLVRSVFLLAHATLRESYDYEVPIQRNGAFYITIPTQWRARNRLTVKVGMSPGERSRMVAALDRIIDLQIMMAREGMEDVLVNVQGFYAALLDRSRIAGVPTPDRYFVDPRSSSAQQALQAKAAEQQRVREMQEQMIAQAIELEQLRTAFEKYKVDVETQFKYWAERQENIRTEAKLAGEATTQLLLERQKSERETAKSKASQALGDRDNRAAAQ